MPFFPETTPPPVRRTMMMGLFGQWSDQPSQPQPYAYAPVPTASLYVLPPLERRDWLYAPPRTGAMVAWTGAKDRNNEGAKNSKDGHVDNTDQRARRQGHRYHEKRKERKNRRNNDLIDYNEAHAQTLDAMWEFSKELKEHNPLFVQDLRSDYYFYNRFVESTCLLCEGVNPVTKGFKNEQWLYTPQATNVRICGGIVVAVFYIFAVLWLSLGMQSTSLCEVSNISNYKGNLSDLAGVPLVCADLLHACSIPYLSGDMTITAYYAFRLGSYFIALLPLLWLSSGAATMVYRFMAPFLMLESHQEVSDKAEKKHWEQQAAIHSAQAQNFFVSFFEACYQREYDANEVYNMTSYMMCCTHIALGIFTVWADGAVVNRFYTTLPQSPTCPASQRLDLVHSSGDRDCACRTLFPAQDPEKSALLMRLSSIELMNPGGVGLSMLLFNIIYIVIALLFIMRTWVVATARRDGLVPRDGATRVQLEGGEQVLV